MVVRTIGQNECGNMKTVVCRHGQPIFFNYTVSIYLYMLLNSLVCGELLRYRMNINQCSWIIKSLLQSVVPASSMPVSILLQLSPTISDLPLERSVMHNSYRCFRLLGQFLAVSHDCLHVTITRTFIYALVTPTYTKESHKICTKGAVCTFMYKLGPTLTVMYY